jgi:NAD(P)-dependent dehydrogenase (short-subunit alcohol dehydrogenase family)
MADHDLTGKVILITGATGGLGLAVAVDAAAAGATVLVHGRNPRRIQAALERVGSAGSGEPPRAYQADLASLAQVRRLARDVAEAEERLDVLVNNAGIGGSTPGGGERQVSEDGHELRFAVNYLAGYLLTRELLPLLERSAPARIVNVSSAGQMPWTSTTSCSSATTAAPRPTARASSPRSCSPSTSPRSSRARA